MGRIALAGLIAMVLAGKAWVADSAEAPASSTAVTVGIVDGGAEGDGLVWFTFSGTDLRFEAPADAVKDPDGLFAAIKDSNSRSADLTVHFDLDSGFIDPASGKATFDIRNLDIAGKTIAGVASSADVRRTPASPTEARLAQAIGAADTANPDAATTVLSSVLEDPKLSPTWRILALKTRGALEEDKALASFAAGPDRDRALVAALADNRAWSALAPDDEEAARNVAYDLVQLGAYEDGMAAYHAIAAKWTDDYASAIGIAAAYRVEGRYELALSTLDDLVKRKGPQPGMRYHYHRARILMGLGRMDEAVKALDAGLASQPDYGWAFAYRACALASLGRLKDAAADQDRAVAEMAKLRAASRPSPQDDVDQAHAAAVAARLRTALVAGPTARLPDLCNGYWDAGETKRDRSPLLPATVETRATP